MYVDLWYRQNAAEGAVIILLCQYCQLTVMERFSLCFLCTVFFSPCMSMICGIGSIPKKVLHVTKAADTKEGSDLYYQSYQIDLR